MPIETDDFGFEDENLPDNLFIVMWCCEGLECIIPVEMDKIEGGAAFLAALEDAPNEYPKQLSRELYFLKLRARANTQRHYEIYSLKTSGSITKETLEHLFETNPQSAADLVRSHGVQLHSDRAERAPAIL